MYLWQKSFLYASVNLRKRNVCKRNCFTVKNEPKEKREFHFKWISKYKGCGILSFAFKEWMVTFEKRLETSSKKLKIKITKKDETYTRTWRKHIKSWKVFFSKKTNNFSVFFLKISSFTCPIAHWTMKKLLQTNIINKQNNFDERKEISISSKLKKLK